MRDALDHGTRDDHRDDRQLLVTRISVMLVTAALLIGAWVLYLFPGQTDRLWAWPVAPELTARTMGAGYAGGALFLIRALWTRRWHTMGVGLLGASVLGWLLLIATIMHWDRFTHEIWASWTWLVIYIVAPVLLPSLWLVNRRHDPGPTPETGPLVPRGVRLVVSAAGAVQLLVALVVFVHPPLGIALWPWPLTALTARTMSGFIAFVSMAWLLFAVEPRWGALRLPISSLTVSMALIALAAVRGRADLDAPAAGVAVFAVLLGGILVAMVWLQVAMRRTEATGWAASPLGTSATEGELR